MKSTHYIQIADSSMIATHNKICPWHSQKRSYELLKLMAIIVLCSISLSSAACGPDWPYIPSFDFLFKPAEYHKPISFYERQENLKLWQSITDPRIPLSDIEKVVYTDSFEDFSDRTEYDNSEDDINLFYNYLNISDDVEVLKFLKTAKKLESIRNKINSRWYYPQERDYFNGPKEFEGIIEECLEYKGKRLKDRYALQISRALFASCRYADCIKHFDSAFVEYPGSNLMKRMAKGYVAGCWARLGEKQKSDSIFAKAGDIWSLSSNEPAEYMATHNPNAPLLTDYIRSKADDKEFMLKIKPIADSLLRSKSLKKRGDWYYISAFINQEYIHDTASAKKNIYKAIQLQFTSDELRDLAHAYKMKLDAIAGNSQALITDLNWLERKADYLNPDAKVWIRICRHIIYTYWVPELWKRKEYATAILLCGYADNLLPAHARYCSDYGSLTFQIMGSLTSKQLSNTYRKMMSYRPLYRFLRRKARTDRDYYYELIGTLALREENYSRAIYYLSPISKEYLKSMNIYRDGYLSRNPFIAYNDNKGGTYYWRVLATTHLSESDCYAKLKFARKMDEYKKTMQDGRTADERGMARLMYALGKRNSQETCWALTQYWKGEEGGPLFSPSSYINTELIHKYEFLYSYYDNLSIDTEKLRREEKEEIDKSLSMLITEEVKAEAYYILGDLETIFNHYDNTPTALFIKASCDEWQEWL